MSECEISNLKSQISNSTHMIDLGQTNSIDVINGRLSLAGKSVIDIGCGAMDFSRLLAESGANVLAIDPDAAQAKLNRESEPVTGIEFVETGAESLPCKPASVDGVFFSFSLHHISEEAYPQVFTEIFRVLRPGGFLAAIEPSPSALNEIMKLFHNEDKERAAAQIALQQIAVPVFASSEMVTYHSFIEYQSFDQFANRFASKSFNELYSEADIRRDAVRTAFEQHAPDFKFISPKQTLILTDFRGN